MKKRPISRRHFMAGAGAAGIGAAISPASAPPARAAAKGRVVILGFDGIDPRILDDMMAAGGAPNFARLREQGVAATLRTTNPPQSPVAWTSFATCKNPGGHGIYDFIRRDPERMFPDVGTGRLNHATLDYNGRVEQPASSIAYRRGEPFWAAADRQGVRAKILNVPFAFPADPLEHGRMLSGLGTPDLRGTTSIFFHFSEDVTEREDVAGGQNLPLRFEDGAATVMLDGARDVRQQRPAYIQTPVTFRVDRDAGTAEVEAQGERIALELGKWSPWMSWSFEVTPHFTVQAISRFVLLECKDRVRVYMSCLQFDPRAPYAPFTHPGSYAAELANRYGLFKTIGWIYDTHALRQDALTEDVFLDDIRDTMEWRARLTLDEIDAGEFDILVSCWTATDRAGHMFWHHRDPGHPMHDPKDAAKYAKVIEGTYRKCDEITGRVLERLRDDDLLMVLSDHGFETFRRGFHVNTWLIRNGYLAVRGQTDPAEATTDTPWLQGYDWARTKAYALGLSSVYLNIRGREMAGTVDPASAPGLIAEIREKLLEVRDPENGAKVFSEIYTRDAYSGTEIAAAPDLCLGYAEAYQNSKDTARGAAPAGLFEDNLDKWSGEHAASDAARLPGIFFANRPLAKKDPDIRDLGVTALAYCGADIPDDLEGAPLA